MAHPLVCPSCNFTTRVSAELFARRVSGRRVKIPCKGCRGSLLVDATGDAVRVTPYRASSRPPGGAERVSSADGADVPSTSPDTWSSAGAPLPRARELQEEDLPTLRQNEMPTDEAFLSPVTCSEAPNTSWLHSIPPLRSVEPSSFRLPARRRGARLAALGLLVVGGVAAASWAIPRWDLVSDSGARDQVRGADGQALGSASTQPSEGPSMVESSRERRLEATEQVAGKVDENGARVGAVVSAAARPAAGTVDVPESQGGSGRAESAQPTPAAVLIEPPRSVEPRADTGAPGEGTARSRETATREVSAEGDPGRDQGERERQAFDKNAAALALRAAEAEAGACRGAGDPSGTARVVVTFAPSGRVTTATVSGAPFAGTTTGGCIAARFRSAQVPAFTGSYVTVTKTVVVR